MNSMIIKCYNKKCHAYHIYPSNNASHINVIDMELPIQKTYYATIVELDG